MFYNEGIVKCEGEEGEGGIGRVMDEKGGEPSIMPASSSSK